MFLGKRIKDLRLQKGLTQQQLGNMVNVTKVSICCYENDTRIPNLDTFEDLMKALDVTADYLLGNDINIIMEDDKAYSAKISKDDIILLDEIKKHKDLYKKLIEDSKRTINLIDKKINKS